MSSGEKAKLSDKQKLDESRQYVSDTALGSSVYCNLSSDNQWTADDQNTYVQMSGATPPPCPGSTLSSADSLANDKHLRDNIMKEIKEFTEPINDTLSKILAEMECLRGRIGTFTEFADASCQTEAVENSNLSLPPTECRTLTELHYINDEDIDIIGTGIDSTEETVTPTLKEKTVVQSDLETNIPSRKDEGQMTREKKPLVWPRNQDTEATSSHYATPRQHIRFSNTEASTNKIVFVTPRQKTTAQSKVYSDNERECLTNALQFHVEDLVSGLDFLGSEVPNSLLAEGCITEDECLLVQKISNRKDQIRALLVLIKTRDMRVLLEFMKHIGRHNESVTAKITRTYESNKRNGVKETMCVLCSLERHINVKHIADSLWSVHVIDDGIYSKIVSSDSSTGAQGTLWRKVIHSLNCLSRQKAELAHNLLLNALSSRNMFTHLTNGIKEMLTQNEGKFICTCEPLLKPSIETFSASPISVKRLSSCRNSDCIKGDFSHNNLTSSESDSVGKISITSEDSKIKPLNTSVRDGTDEIDSIRPHGEPSVSPKKCSPSETVVSDYSTPKILPRHRTCSESKLTVLKPSENALVANTTLPRRAPPTLPKKPTRYYRPVPDISEPSPLRKMTKDDQDCHEIIETQDIGSLDSKIPPLPTKKNKNPEWKKISHSDIYLV